MRYLTDSSQFSEVPLNELPTRHDIISITRRPRRNRSNESIRSLVCETHLAPEQLISPLFVKDSPGIDPIKSMPDVYRFSIDALLKEVEELLNAGVRTINLFCFNEESKKDYFGTEATRACNLLQRSITAVKTRFPEVLVMADIALDPFTTHGHDGLIDPYGTVLNDPTLIALGQMSLRACEAGVDFISPSDMMDGRIGFIRKLIDSNGFATVGILSYCVKYTSALYGPFRDALESSPKIGDKKNYQLNPANSREALLECLLDEQEGADLLLIKPAITSLDIIAKLRSQTMLPIGAYQVSGEYSMIKAAAERGWIDGPRMMLESLTAIRRAGADFILTYAAKEAALALKR